MRQEDEDEGEGEEGRQPGVFAHRALAVFAHNPASMRPRGGKLGGGKVEFRKQVRFASNSIGAGLVPAPALRETAGGDETRPYRVKSAAARKRKPGYVNVEPRRRG